MNIKMLKAAVAGLVLSVSGFANAGMIGLDINTSSNWITNSSDSWTLGYEFSVSGNMNVDGLGFWDLTGVYNSTTVGLWDINGNLLGSVNTATSSVNTFGTGAGHGTWNFMNFNYSLTSGSYIVASWGDGMEYTFNNDINAITTNGLTFVDAREQPGGIFQYPTQEFYSGAGFFGGNISFGNTNQVPEPSTLAIFALGIMGLASRRFKKQ